MLVRQLYNYIFGDYANIDGNIDKKLFNATTKIKSEEDLNKAMARLTEERDKRLDELIEFFQPVINIPSFRPVLRNIGSTHLEDALYGNHTDFVFGICL